MPRTPIAIRQRKVAAARKRKAAQALVASLTPATFPPLPRFLQGRARIGGYYGRYTGASGAPEQKFLDTVDASTVVAATGTILVPSFTLVAQDATESGRNGRAIRAKRLNLHGILTLPAAAAAADMSDVVRLVIYKDTQCNGSAATIALLLQGTSLNDFRLLENSKRFQFIWDKTFNLNTGAGPVAASTYPAINRRVTINKTLTNEQIQFDGTTGAITEIRTITYGMFGISLNGKCAFASTARFRYTDH